jgi:hypothetical protein
VIGLSSDHDHRQVAARFDLLQPLHHLKSIHAGHLKVEQDQVITVLSVQVAHLARIGGRLDGGVPGDPQHALQQKDIGFLIVNDQDSGLQNIG